MRRLFWLALGATAGVLLVRRLRAYAGRFTPEGLADRAAVFWARVRSAAAERELELRDALGLDGRHDEVDVHTMGDNR